MRGYVELHCHSCFSFREGASTPLELVMQARILGYTALALTDHDNLAGAMEFANTAKDWDLRPITGAEITIRLDNNQGVRRRGSSSKLRDSSRRPHLDKAAPAADTPPGHLTLLAETPRGYANLSRLLSRANLASPRGEPAVRFDWLAEHAEGLIALSGCRKGEVARLVAAGEPRAARAAAERYRALFGRESFFIELQDNLAYEDQPRNEGLVALARDLDIEVVATNNVHYHDRGRHRLHDVLVAVRHRTSLEEARPYLRPNSEFYLKHPAEMERLFDGLPEALANTLRIAGRCTGTGSGQRAASDGESQQQAWQQGEALRYTERVSNGRFRPGSVTIRELAALYSARTAAETAPEPSTAETGVCDLRAPATHPYRSAPPAISREGEDTSTPPAGAASPITPAPDTPDVSEAAESAVASAFARMTAMLGGRFPRGHEPSPSEKEAPALKSRLAPAGPESLLEPLPARSSVAEPALTAQPEPACPEPRRGIEGPSSADGVSSGSSALPDCPIARLPAAQPVSGPGFSLVRDLSYRFPDYEAPDGRSADDFLRDVCYRRARDYYGAPLPEQVEIRLRKELDLVRQGRRAGFFLRLWELLRYAHERDLPARGRGSSVGSMVCFLLGLSGIDPMKYHLVVERFLNEDRLQEDVPDIDLDFGRKARDEMFRSIFAKYGTEYAAQVCNFIEYRYPSAIRDVGRALGLPEGEIDKVAKRMRSRFARSLADELRELPEFAARLRFPIWRDFVDLVEEVRGMPRHLSQHSGGIIISTTRIDEQVPVERAAMDGRFICQWDKDSVADAGFIKLDLLGYPSLDQLERGLRYVRERHGRVTRPEDIDLADQRVYEMIQQGDVIGIVQIQSRAQIQVLMRIRVARIEDLIIQVALIRPGPIQGGAVHPYIARCLGQEEVTYDHPSLAPVLAETKGVFVFQEQVVQAAMCVAGFTSGQAEQLRRAMSRKRSRGAMEALRNEFFAGAARKGVGPQVAAIVYEKILAFAEFGFPKSHAAAMAETAFRVAWLKRYYAPEFYCALLNEQPMGFYSPEVICNDARRHDIEVLGADVNHSGAECSIEVDPARGRDALRLGYRYVKGLGEAALRRLEEERRNGPYRSLRDFWRRTRLGREAIENLIRVGAFAWTGLHERELLWQLGTFYQPLDAQLPLPLLQPEEAPALRPPTHRERLVTDLALVGLAVRGRTMDLVADQLHEGITPSHLVNEMAAGTPVTVAGLVAVRQAPETAKGFVFHTLEDYTGLVNVITKPQLVKSYRRLIEGAPALIVHGHIERQERAVNVIAERFEPLPIVSAAERRVHSFG